MISRFARSVATELFGRIAAGPGIVELEDDELGTHVLYVEERQRSSTVLTLRVRHARVDRRGRGRTETELGLSHFVVRVQEV